MSLIDVYGGIPLRLHDWLIGQLGDCAPKPCKGKECNPVGYCNPANWFPTGKSCTPSLWVTPGAFVPVLTGTCARQWRRRYTITFVVGCLPMPGSTGCDGSITTTVAKVDRCGLAFTCALDALRSSHLFPVGEDYGMGCGLIETGSVACLTAGDCAGWQAEIIVPMGFVSAG
jgi:hypothetical protein